MLPATSRTSALLATLVCFVVILISSFSSKSQPQRLWYCLKSVIEPDGFYQNYIGVASAKSKKDAEEIFNKKTSNAKPGKVAGYIVIEIGADLQIWNTKDNDAMWADLIVKPAPKKK